MPNQKTVAVEMGSRSTTGDQGPRVSDTRPSQSSVLPPESFDHNQSIIIKTCSFNHEGILARLPFPLVMLHHWVTAINWKLYSSLLLLRFLTVSHKTFRYRLLGEIADDDLTTINAQVQWVVILEEIIEETFLIPLFACIGSTVFDRVETINKYKTGLVTSVAVFLPFTLAFVALGGPLVDMMKVSPGLRDVTVQYTRLEMLVTMIEVINEFGRTVLTITDAWPMILGLAVTRTAVHMAAAAVFWGKGGLDFGALGIAYANLAAECLIFLLVNIGIMIRLRMTPLDFGNPLRWRWDWLRRWSRIGFFSCADSVTRNITYLFIILRLINEARSGGHYWVIYGFCWGWLMMPFLPMMEVVKQDISSRWKSVEYKGRTRGLLTRHVIPYVLFCIFLLLVWLALIPVYEIYYTHIVSMPDKATVLRKETLLLLPAYVANMPKGLLNAVSRYTDWHSSSATC